MRELHSLLERQLKRYSAEMDLRVVEQTELLQAINDAYWQSDEDREMLQHSMELTSRELLEMNSALQKANHDLEVRVAERTANLDKANEELASQSENLSALYTHGQEINSSLDLKSIYASTHRAASRLMPGDVFVISILDESNQRMDDVYLWDKDQLWKNEKYPCGQDLPGYIISTNKPLRINDWDETHDKLTGATTFGYEDNDIKSVLAVPISRSGGKPFGMLSIQSYISNVYMPEHENLLILLANQLSKAIENAHLYEEAQHELTDRERAETALLESESRLRTIVDSEPECVKVLDADGNLQEMNPAGLAMIEADTFDQVKGEQVLNIVMPNYRAAFKSLTDRVLAGESGTLEFEIVGLKGTHRWLETHAVPLRNSEGVVTNLLGVTRDITERKQAEDLLKENQDRYRSLFENSPISLWEEDYSEIKTYFDHLRDNGVTDFQEYFDNHPEAISECADLVKVLDVNHATLDLMKIEDKAVVLGPLSKSINKDALPSFKVQLINMANGNLAYERDEIFVDNDGNKRHIFISLSVTPGHVEKLDKVLVSIIDITDRKQADAALRDSEERFRLLFDRMMDGVYRSTHEGRFVDINPAMVKMFGYSNREEMLEVDIKNELYFVPEERGSHILDTGQEETDVYRMRRKDGSEIWVEDHGSYVHDENGNVIYHEGILRDITERKQAEEAIRAQDRLLLESQRIAKLGHYHLDIKTNMLESSEALNDVLGIDRNYPGNLNNWVNLIHPIEREEILAYLTDHVLKGRKPFDREFQIIRFNDKQERWVHVLGRLEFGAHGEPARMIGTVQDITERKQVESETLRHLKEAEALYENGLAISRLLTPGEIGRQLIETFASYLSWHHVTIRLRKDESDSLELIGFNEPGLVESEKAEKERLFKSMITNVGQGLSGWVVQTGQPLRTGNVFEHPQYIRIINEIKSGLYMPLKIGERVLGVISVESEEADAFSAQDERLLATLANQAAVAFENARLYQAAQQELAERKRAENALKNSETHYRDLADSITDIMYELDQNLRLTYWNKSAELITGVPTIDALGKSLGEIFGESKEQTDVEKIFLNVLLNRSRKSFEVFLNLNKEERAYEINAYPSSTGVSIVAKDVTERKLSEMIMQKRFELMNFAARNSLDDVIQKMLDEITELINSPIGFFHFMKEDQSTPGRQMWSTQALQLFNVPASEGHHRGLDQAGVWADAVRQRHPLIQNNYESLPKKKGLPEGHADLIREMVIPIIRNERVVAVMGIGNKPQDYTQPDVETAVRFADQAWDIVEKKQMEMTLAEERNQLATRVEERTADLIRANSNLARALRVKDEFLANMSHELRTPLNAILGLSESLGEQTAGPLNEKQSRYITTISESGHHLLSLINDILDLAKIDAGQITLNINKVDINSICEASLRLVKQLALKKNQEVALNIDTEIGLMWADERRLKQMLVNLLSNAVKFTPENGKVGMEVRGDQTVNQVSFAVWDNGIGIKDDDMPLLFQPFVQLNGGLARESAGTGLGLVLVAQMARLHGGGVTVESLPGKGSRFTLTLPWEPALAPDTVERMRNTGRLPALHTDDHGKRTILLIEDTEEVTMMLKDYLENIGFRVITAQDGIEGIDKANLTHPDLILMDIQMPRIDGFEATKRLRGDPSFKHTPIIALTALAMPNDRERCIAAGMDEYISKPVNLKVLVKIIQNILTNKHVSEKPR